MPDVPKDVLEILYQLLPGFFAAGLFYTLTAHPKGNSFERIVQALIFTAIIRAFVAGIERVCLLIGDMKVDGHHLSIGPWTTNSTLAWSFALAGVLGVLMSRNAHSPFSLFEWMQKLSCSRRTASPSQWYSAFYTYQQWVILTVEGERRIKGWAEEWPDECDKGHFLLWSPRWVLDDGTDVELLQVHRMLVPAKQVSFVEFVKNMDELPLPPEEVRKQQQPLLDLLEREKDHGERDTQHERTKSESESESEHLRGEPPEVGEQPVADSLGSQAVVVTGTSAEEMN